MNLPCVCVLIHSVVSNSLWPCDCSPPGSSVHSPAKNTGVGCHALLLGIFQTQGSNPGLPHCRRILYHLSQQQSPRILEWIVYPFSRGPSQPRNRIKVSCIVGGFLTSWTTGKPKSPVVWHYWLGKKDFLRQGKKSLNRSTGLLKILARFWDSLEQELGELAQSTSVFQS